MKRPLFLLILITLFCGSPASGAQDTAPLEQFDFATGLFQRGMYQMAADEYNKFIGLFPQSEYAQDAYFGIAESYYFLKNYDEAMKRYKDYMEKFPSGSKVLLAKLRIGEAFFFSERFDEAVGYFRAIEKEKFTKEDMQTLNFYTAKSYRAKNNKKDAIKYFESAVRILEQSEVAFLSLHEMGDMYSEDSDYGEALKCYIRARDIATSGDKRSFSLFKVAEAQFLSGNYPTSLQNFKDILDNYPESGVSAEALSNLLLSLYNTKRYEELIAEFAARQSLIKKEDKFFNAHFTVCNAHAELGNYDHALSCLDTLISSDWAGGENAERAVLKKAEILLRAKRCKEALDVIESRLSRQEKYAAQVLFLKGEALYGLGNLEEAVVEFNRLIKEFPDSPFATDAAYSIGYAQKSLGKNKEARDSFIRYFEKSKDDTKRQAALYNAILLDIKNGDSNAAVSDGRTYLEVFPKGEFKEKLLFRLATVYSELNQHRHAIDYYKEFIEVSKNSRELQDAYFRLAYSLQEEKKFDEALKYYEKMAQDKDVNSLYYYALKNKTLIYLIQDKSDEAAQIYDHIISEFPENDLGIDAYLWLAKHYLESKRFEGTIRVLEKAKAGPGAKDKTKEISYFKAEAYKETKYLSKAIENYDIVLSSKKADAFTAAAHIGKGLCLIENEEPDKAKEEFEAAILENPDDNTIAMRARFEIAGIEYLKGNLEEAYKIYMMIAILYDDRDYCPRALLSAGDIFRTLGKKDEAKKAYEEIIQKYGKTGFVRNARDRLKNLN